MSMIKAENLTFSYPGSYDNVFENVSFQIDTNWKLGFIGRNGRGKTTFLNLLLGKYEYSGHIQTSAAFDYFPYQIADRTRFTFEILEEICPLAEDWEVIRELAYLHVDAEVLYRPFETLSNGEQTKVLLAALFLKEGQFLLIDEPTNHLDVEAREFVSSYLNRKKGFILVSHDRAFLDGCVDHILSINRSNIEVQAGNYTSWKQNFDRQQEFELAQNLHLQKDVARLREAAGRTKGWSEQVEASKFGTTSAGLKPDRGFVGHKSAKMMKRAKSIEARQQKAIEDKSRLLKNVERNETLCLYPLEYHGNLLAELSCVTVSYDQRETFAPVSFQVRQGDRIALDGRNGSGKSSILKLINGYDISHTGTIKIASGLIISYVPQDTSHLKGSLTDYAKEKGIEESLFKAILRKLDFERTQFDKDMTDFSGGQKKKVLIAGSLCERAHLYVWDEPLNFIDIYSRMQIEELLSEFKPTMIFVEHDRVFREAIATGTVTIIPK